MLLKEYPVQDNTQSIAEYAETVAKAQLKKVVEAVDLCLMDMINPTTIYESQNCKAFDVKKWQTLLKELEE